MAMESEPKMQEVEKQGSKSAMESEPKWRRARNRGLQVGDGVGAQERIG